MDTIERIDHGQATLWNGIAGEAWVEAQELLDQVFRPFEDLLVQSIRDRSARSVLDVGCGTGSTTLAAARLLAGNGCCAGIDISGPMIAAAKARAERESMPAYFMRADAQIHAFERARFDMIISRFGVMFFDDPVRAFENLRHAAMDTAELQFIAWRSAAENPFMIAAERAAAPLLPNLPVRRKDGPGQFGFADARRVRTILEESGWSDIDIRPIDVTCTLREKDLELYLTRLGPVGMLLQEVDDRTRTAVIKTVRAAFEPYVYGAEVRFNAACWTASARACGRRGALEMSDTGPAKALSYS